jgi:hypothetical protein
MAEGGSIADRALELGQSNLPGSGRDTASEGGIWQKRQREDGRGKTRGRF